MIHASHSRPRYTACAFIAFSFLLLVVASVASGQTASKRYVYVGGRLVAVDIPGLPIAVSISPAGATLTEGQTQAFTATVSNAADPSVTWSIVGPGSLEPSPTSNPVTFRAASVSQLETTTLRATSQQDPSKFDEVTIDTAPAAGGGVTVTVDDPPGSLQAGETFQFVVSVSEAHTAEVWSIISPIPALGSITGGAGLYTAPDPICSTAQETIQVDVTLASGGSESTTAVVDLTVSGECGPPSTPQLTISGVTSPPSQVTRGGNFTVRNQVQNSTSGAADDVVIRYYLSSDTTLQPGSDTLLNQTFPFDVGAFASVTAAPLTVTVSASQPTGSYWFIAYAAETGDNTPENANCGGDTICYALEVLSQFPNPGDPDFVPTNPSYFLTITTLDNPWAILGAFNQGQTWTSAGETLFIRGTVSDGVSTIFTQDQAVANTFVPASSATAVITPYTFANPGLGDYSWMAEVDPFNQIPGDPSSNNTSAAFNFIVIPPGDPDLRCSLLTVSATTVSPGDSVTVSCTIPNDGPYGGGGTFRSGIYLSSGSMIDPSDERLGDCLPSSLTVPAPGGTTSCSATVTIPTTTVPGDYHVGVHVDDQLVIAEELETNNGTGQPISVSGPPQVVSVTPNAGQGAQQTFTFTASDPNGANDISRVEVIMNGTSNWPGSCGLIYDNVANLVYVISDGGTAWLGGLTPGSAGQISNSTCQLDVAGVSVTKSGTLLTIDYPLTLTTSLSASRNIYMSATAVDNGFVNFTQLGSWGFPGATPNVGPINEPTVPASGAGLTQTFVVKFSDVNGASDLAWTHWKVAASVGDDINACTIWYNQPNDTMYLYNIWAEGFTPGSSSGTVSNAYCTIDKGAVAKATNGNELTLSIPITFESGFSGTQNIYQYVNDMSGAYVGWQQMGTWDVSTPGATPEPPQVGTVTPSSGQGAQQTFTFTVADPNGAADIKQVEVMMMQDAISWTGSCGVIYNNAADLVYLFGDDGYGWIGGVQPGTATQISNATCSLDVGATEVTPSGTILTLKYPLTFTTTISATRKVRTNVVDLSGAQTSHLEVGTWTFPGAITNLTPSNPPTVPASGSGVSQMFTVTFRDPNRVGDLGLSAWQIADSLGPASNGCYLQYNAVADSLILYDLWGESFTPNVGSGTLDGAKCNLDTGGVTKTVSGNDITLTFPLTFDANFTGPKNIYQIAIDKSGAYDGWDLMGTWDIPGPGPLPPVAHSVVPSSGSGAGPQTFTFTVADPNGAVDISRVEVMMMQDAISWTGACGVIYNNVADLVYLESDDGFSWIGGVQPGTATQITNATCSLDVGATEVIPNGTILTLRYPLTFTSNVSATRRIRTHVLDVGGASTGFLELGTWTFPGATANLTPSNPPTVPSTGSGLSQTFTVTFRDPNGAGDLGMTNWKIAPSVNEYTNACLLYYNAVSDEVLLYPQWGARFTPNVSTGILTGSTCSIDSAGVTKTVNGDDITLTFPLIFDGALSGPQNIYQRVFDKSGAYAGWDLMGTWDISGP